MNKASLRTILSIFLAILLFIAEAIAFLTIKKLNMFPDIYLIAAAVVLMLGWLLCALLLLLPSKGKRNIRKVIALVLTVSIIAGCAVVTNVVGKLYNTMHSITKPNTTTVSISVYVMANDPAQTIQDASGYSFGISYTAESDFLSQALDRINKELGQVETIIYSSVPEMVNALYSGEVKAIIMDSAYVSLLEDFEMYADFEVKTKLIYEITIEQLLTEPSLPETSIPDDDIQNDPEMKPFVVYLSGSDTRNPTLTRSRSDVNIVIVVNPETKQILMVNTPRDYYVANPAGKGALDKLTHCGIYGIDCSVNALSDLYDVDIDYYAQINFYGFQTLIDSIGGITVYNDVAFNAHTAPYHFPAGLLELDGSHALAFARQRYGLPGGDNARGKNQMKVISAVIEKLTSGATIISNYSDILNSLTGMFQSDFSMDHISDLVKMQLTDMATWNIQSFAVTGSGSSKITYSMPGQYVYVMIPNEKTVAHATNLIDRVIAGETLTANDMTVN